MALPLGRLSLVGVLRELFLPEVEKIAVVVLVEDSLFKNEDGFRYL
jgi:hypothetical protein